MEDVVLVCCLAHFRRKFYEALPAGRKKNHKLLDIRSEQEMKKLVLPNENDLKNWLPTEIGLVYCNALF